MAPENNWLSFSLSSMEMLNSSSQSSMLQSNLSSSTDSHHYYFADNFYPHGWSNPKPQVMYSEGENHVNEVTRQNMNNNSFGFQGYMDSQMHQQSQPKLEDFLGNDFRYSDSQTETQDSSLTHIYHDHQDLKSIAAGFQTFSTNSGSEVEDSASVGRTTQVMGGDQFIESGNELGFSQCATGALSLAVNNTHSSQKPVVAVESESCKKISDTFGQRTSIYRGVTRHRWTGRYEAHLWDNSCKREGQARKGRQVYLGGYDKEDKAARAYDLAALKYWGSSATTNLPVSNYSTELEEMKHMTKQEFIASLRRKSSGFSRGASKYRGVTRHHQQGRWQARIGRVAGNKDLYLGTFATEEEAAEAYDIAAIKFRGVNAVTNFEMNRYDVEAIMKSALPVGGAAKRLKLSLESEQKLSLCNNQQIQSNSTDNHSISFGAMPHISPIPYGVPFDTAAPYYHHNFFHQLHTNNAGASDASGAITTMAAAMPTLNSPAELFFWPHQSY